MLVSGRGSQPIRHVADSDLSGNLVGQTYIHGSVGGVLGAFAVSLLGSIYARIWNGYAFAAMIPGVLLLVPVESIALLYSIS